MTYSDPQIQPPHHAFSLCSLCLKCVVKYFKVNFHEIFFLCRTKLRKSSTNLTNRCAVKHSQMVSKQTIVLQFGRSDPNVYTLFAITVRSPFTGRSKNASIQYTLRPPAMSSSAKWCMIGQVAELNFFSTQRSTGFVALLRSITIFHFNYIVLT